MLRILHLTDFHLNPKNLKDWEDYVKDPMVEKLIALNAELGINLVAFTGDLLDKGGKDYPSISFAFNLFKTKVIEPILLALNLTIDKFLIIPGNHDVQRTLDSERDELGSLNYFLKASNVSNFILNSIKNNDFVGMKRIEGYKEFEKSLYPAKPSNYYSIFGSSYKFSINSISVGISCLNSSWRCYSNNDDGNLIIGEDQLVANTRHIKDCDVKIALVHHPLDVLSVVERSTISNHLHKDFDLLLIGHTHETVTSVTTGFIGTLFTNVAPSGINDIRSDSRTFANGFTIIDFDKRGKTVKCIYWRYNHGEKDFVINTDAGSDVDGTSNYMIPDKQSAKKTGIINTILSNIKEDHFLEMDEHLIGYKALTAQSNIKEAFIFPPIDQGNSPDEEPPVELYNVTQITQYRHNLMFFGNQESGKTVLLYRLVREYVDEFEYVRKIPAYIDFEEIGHKDIITCIREYLRCGVQDVKDLLKNNQLVILIDNLHYSKNGYYKDQLNRLHTFSNENQNVQFIGTSDHDILGILPPEYIELSKIPFLNFYIRNLRSKEIKSLMKVWLPNEDSLQEGERLEKMVSTFNSYSLPSTAMSVSLFLWSTENSERKPINNAVLMEIYIEIILEKLDKENIYRGTFDFTNKIQLLAKIAQEMLDHNQPGLSLLYSQFVSIVEDYLKNLVGFTHDPEIIIKYLIDRKLFIKYQGNRIKFTYSCFLYFFIGKRMEFDSDFRKYILDESRYFKFPQEIDYYTGLTRSDKSTLKLILDRFETAFKPTEIVLTQVDDIDRYFTPFTSPEDKVQAEKEIGEPIGEPVARNVDVKQISENRPSEQVMEHYYNKRLSAIADPNKILVKDSELTLERLLIIMSNTLRNSEGVEDLALKRRAYKSLMKYNLTFMILYKENLMEFIRKNEKLPNTFSSNSSIESVITNIPLSIQLGMTKHLGTQKLSSIIVEKMNSDSKRPPSNVEAFLSVGLYSDIQGAGFEKYFYKFIKTLKTNANSYIVSDYSFYKLVDYYYRRTKSGSPNEEIYLNLLAELRIRSQKLPKRMKEGIIKVLEDSKKKFAKNFK